MPCQPRIYRELLRLDGLKKPEPEPKCESGHIGSFAPALSYPQGWEKAYMTACVDAQSITLDDDVLEIGFGLGCSAMTIPSIASRGLKL